jgi:uncharacterized membrane protein
MAYEIAQFVHITGVIMLMGNITVTAIWKFFADREGSAPVLAFAQKLVTYTDLAMTVWGVILTMAGGYYMAFAAGYDLTSGWLLWSQILFVAAGLIWLGAIVPLQIKQARAARAFPQTGVTPAYRAWSRQWLVWGLISTVPLVTVTWLMIAKPA